MDEQRIQAYATLIQVLLSCPSGQEPAILQQNQDLVDQGLVVVMAETVRMLQKAGRENDANWLEQMATQLTQKMGIENTSPFEPETSSDLGMILRALSQSPSDLNDIARQIVLCQQALQLLSRQENESLWAMLQGKLGYRLYQNQQGDRAEHIEDAIEAYGRALEVMTREAMPLGWAKSMNNLAAAYTDRIRGDRAENIEEAIVAYEKSLEVMTRGVMPIEWAQSMNNLAIAYTDRIRGDRAENIEEAIKAYQASLEVMTQEDMPIEWARSMNNLANAYENRIRGNRAENIEKAIVAYEKSLEVMTREAMPVEWAWSMTNLANAYANRLQGDRAENIEDAIKAYRQALQVRTQEDMPIEWANSMNNLANAYADCLQGNRAENIEDAIKAYWQALQMTPRETMPIEWAQSMNNLATAYTDRIRGDRVENIEDAIKIHRKALQVRTRETMPIEWAQSMDNLANAYMNRIRGNRAENIEKAIAAYEQALQVRTREAMPIEWAQSMNNLAIAYADRMQGSREKSIEDAINFYRQALQVTTREAMPIEWAQSMNNLAIAYTRRSHGDRAENIEKVISTYRQALQVRTREAMPTQWATSMNNLATAYTERVRGDHVENIESAANAYAQALEIFTPETHPDDSRNTARRLANLYANDTQWDKAQIRYETALSAVEVLYQAALSKSSQEAELSETNDLYRRAAYAFAKVGNLTAASTTLEQGRARGLSETLQRDRANLETLRQTNPDLVERYQTAANAINLLESTERRLTNDNQLPQYSQEDFRKQATQARQALKDCLTEIRQLPGYENFLSLPTFQDVAATLQPKHPLIYLLTTPNGSLALILTPEGIIEIWLDNLNQEGWQDILQDWLTAYRDHQQKQQAWAKLREAHPDWQNYQTEQNKEQEKVWLEIQKNHPTYKEFISSYQAWLQAIDDITQQLWGRLMKDVVARLIDLDFHKAILIPTGYLSYLPLHAAWTSDTTKPNGRRYACDDIQFTYTPNALSLNSARSVANQTSANTLLAINEPQPVNAGNLPSSSAEAAKAISVFGKGNWKLLQQDNATRTAVLEQLPHKNVVHFSCHGSADFRSPLNSGLLMADNEILSLRDLLDLKLQSLRLAILSACETCIPGTKLPDEVISLPTGLLQAGAAGVVSSLWSVADLSTMVLLIRFYDLWRIEDLDPPEALRQAQVWLRDSDGPELAPYLQASNPEFAQKLEKADDQRPFAHPFYWAAFAYVGV